MEPIVIFILFVLSLSFITGLGIGSYFLFFKESESDVNTKNTDVLENQEIYDILEETTNPQRNNSCYGTGDNVCNTCVDVVNSYKKKNWAYDINNFDQCKINSSSINTCYGTGDTICNSCVDVVNSYKKKNWAYDINNFDQCKM